MPTNRQKATRASHAGARRSRAVMGITPEIQPITRPPRRAADGRQAQDATGIAVILTGTRDAHKIAAQWQGDIDRLRGNAVLGHTGLVPPVRSPARVSCGGSSWRSADSP